MMHRSRRTAGWLALAGCALLSAGTAQAAPADSAVNALARLSAADLDTARPKGAALFTRLFPKPTDTCQKPTGIQPRFDRMCFWYANPDAEFPDLMIGMLGTQIVGAWTAHDRLPKAVWSCRPVAADAAESGERRGEILLRQYDRSKGARSLDAAVAAISGLGQLTAALPSHLRARPMENRSSR